MPFRTLLPLALGLVALAAPALAAPANGDFEADPNTAWLRPGPGAPRAAAGDQAHVARTGIGRFGRAGDRDGRGADGESPSFFFQRFRCQGEGGPCVVTFRFRSSLKRAEVAWVRITAGDLERAWRLPATGAEWKGPVGVEFGECGAEIAVDFGILSHEGEHVAGTVDVDDVTATCGAPRPELSVPAAPELGGLLPPVAAEGSPLPLVVPQGPSGPGLAALVAAGIFVTLFLLFVLRKSREPAPPGA